MARKFISFLGTGEYKGCNYVMNNEIVEDVRFVQEALIRICCKEFSKDDHLCFLLTEQARSKNWISETGLEMQMKKICADLYENEEKCPTIDVIDIPSGKNEEEIWIIFQKTSDLLGESDSIIFDITHGFRSLPLLFFAAMNYAGFLKNTTIEAIYYGAFDAKDEHQNAPIFDLTPFYSLMRWANAADAFVNYGYADKLSALVNETAGVYRGSKNAGSQIKAAADDLNTVRGASITEGSVFIKCVKKIDDLQKNPEFSIHPAFEPLFHNVKDKFSSFTKDNPFNFLHAAKLHLAHGREQQAITFLQEGIITVILQRTNADWKNRTLREETAWVIQSEIHTYKDTACSEKKQKDENLQILLNTMRKDDFFKAIIPVYDKLATLRNNINHGGYSEPMRAQKIIQNAQKYYDELEKICFEYPII